MLKYSVFLINCPHKKKIFFLAFSWKKNFAFSSPYGWIQNGPMGGSPPPQSDHDKC